MTNGLEQRVTELERQVTKLWSAILHLSTHETQARGVSAGGQCPTPDDGSLPP